MNGIHFSLNDCSTTTNDGEEDIWMGNDVWGINNQCSQLGNLTITPSDSMVAAVLANGHLGTDETQEVLFGMVSGYGW